MKKFDISIPVEVLDYDELSAGDRHLVELAREATFRSYAPYSHFSVGAAILLDNGEIVEGANQENVAYPSGTCAERSACYYAHARYPEARFEAIAIAARGTDGDFTSVPTAPCGACRQALLEYEMLAGHDVRVMLAGRDCVYLLPSVKSLLPLAFTEF
ncbi:MAG: cytidine deaminase [Muribaculaceae bacterium]|nr:cytidine deaminase [Muribaculaceae bacterium]